MFARPLKPRDRVAMRAKQSNRDQYADGEGSTVDQHAKSMTPNELAKYIMTVFFQRFKGYAVKCMVQKDGQARRALNNRESSDVIDHIKLVTSAPLRSEHIKTSNIQNILEAILNRQSRKFAFPPDVVEVANNAYMKYEDEKWGAPPAESSSASATLPAQSQARLRRGSAPTKMVRKFARDHPIFGDKGIMRGMMIKNNRPARADDAAEKPRDSWPIGHNGLEVGQWWPYQFCAFRDGAHGKPQAGISSTKETGVRSVIVNNIDSGLEIWYAMPGADKHTDRDNYGAQNEVDAMELSWQRNQDIRVIRGSGAAWSGSPAVGFRYDGLYRVADTETKTNEHGGLYRRFKLVRQDGQPTLSSCKSRPTREEIKQFHKIKDYYEY